LFLAIYLSMTLCRAIATIIDVILDSHNIYINRVPSRAYVLNPQVRLLAYVHVHMYLRFLCPCLGNCLEFWLAYAGDARALTAVSEGIRNVIQTVPELLIIQLTSIDAFKFYSFRLLLV
jgi:hypothetical protein